MPIGTPTGTSNNGAEQTSLITTVPTGVVAGTYREIRIWTVQGETPVRPAGSTWTQFAKVRTGNGWHHAFHKFATEAESGTETWGLDLNVACQYAAVQMAVSGVNQTQPISNIALDTSASNVYPYRAPSMRSYHDNCMILRAYAHGTQDNLPTFAAGPSPIVSLGAQTRGFPGINVTGHCRAFPASVGE
jgi:hypothetical protein